jgi:hypothetical protein
VDLLKGMTFSRYSIAYNNNGTIAPINQPRYENGKYDKGIMIEEGTTNLVPNPLAKDNLDCIKSVFGGGGAGVVTRETNLPSGSPFQSGVKFVVSVNSDSNVYFSGTTGASESTNGIPVSPSTVYSFSAWVYIESDSVIGLSLRPIEWTSAGGVVKDNTLFIQSAKRGWNRISGRLTTQSTTARVTLRFRLNGTGTIYVTGAQVERKNVVTTFCEGSRQTEDLLVPTTFLNASEGTIQLWAYVDTTGTHSANNPNWSMLFTSARTISSPYSERNQISIRRINSSTNWRVDFSNGSGSHGGAIALGSITQSGWYHFAISWKTDVGGKAYLNGVLKGQLSSLYLPTEFDYETARIGSWLGYAHYSNTVIDDFRISSRARSDAEILADYQANSPLLIDRDTTLKLDFDIPWFTPITNWTAEDVYNFYDLDRVETNTIHVAQILSNFRADPLDLEAVTDRTVKRIEFADSLNRIEGNIQTLADNFFEPEGWQDTKTDWQISERPKHSDVNRWENNLLLLYVLVIKAIDSLRYTGTFYAGEDGDIY